MLITQLRNQTNFTTSEKHIADYIIENLQSFGSPSTEELGRLTHTSKATVTRLCKKLGQSSYNDFLDTLKHEIRDLKRVNAMLDAEPINANTSYEDLKKTLPVIYERAITYAQNGLDKNVFRRVINRLKKASYVDIYGIGITNTVAELMAFKLSTLGIRCSAHSGLNEHYIIADQNVKDKMAFVLSFTGKNSSMVRTARWLNKHGIYTVGIGSDMFDDLKKESNEYITIKSEADFQGSLLMGFEILTTFTAVNYIVDMIFTSLLVENYDRTVLNAVQVLRNETEESKK